MSARRLDPPAYVGLLVFDGTAAEEHRILDGSPIAGWRRVPTPRAHVESRASGVLRVYSMLRRIVRPLVCALYLFPLLLLVKLFLLSTPAGQMLTLAYVGLLLLFGTLFAALVLLFAVVGPPSKRKLCGELALPHGQLDRALRCLGRPGVPLTSGAALATHARGRGPSSTPIRVRGRLAAAVGGEGGAVARDCWAELGDKVVQVYCGQSLLIAAPEQPPVVLELDAAPTLLGPYQATAGADLLETLGEPVTRELTAHGPVELEEALRGGQRCGLADGDQVELVAFAFEPVADLRQLIIDGRPVALARDAEDDATAGPYRGGAMEPGLLVRVSPDAPVLLRRV